VRVAIISDVWWPHWKGGGERRYHELATRLGQRGHEITALTMHTWDGPSVLRPSPNVEVVGICPDLGVGAHRNARHMLRWANAVMSVLPDLQADVVECLAFPYAAAFAIARHCRRRDIPLVCTWHEYYGWWHWRRERPLFAPGIVALERMATRLGNRVVAVSEFTADRLRRVGVQDSRLRVIHNGVDQAAIDRSEPWGDTYDALFVGRLIGAKRVDLLLRGLSGVPGVTMGVVGDGDARAAYEALTQSLGVADRVSFLGSLPEDAQVWGQMKRSRVLVVPSQREGFGLVAGEANAAGVPVLAAEFPGSATARLVTEGRFHGVTCPPTSEGMATALARVFAGHSCDRCADVCRAAARRWSWETAVDATEALYLELAGAGEQLAIAGGD